MESKTETRQDWKKKKEKVVTLMSKLIEVKLEDSYIVISLKKKVRFKIHISSMFNMSLPRREE